MVFRNPAEVNYRAVRDMGLAAWFGGSLMGLAGLVSASKSQQDPGERHHVLDAGWKGSRWFLAGAITAYLVGTGLVRFDGEMLGRNNVPRWIQEGPENPARTATTIVALLAAVGAKWLRAEGTKLYMNQGSAAVDQAERLRKQAHALHAVVPAATGWLLYSHLKQDMRRR